jgi:hypothetical protein
MNRNALTGRWLRFHFKNTRLAGCKHFMFSLEYRREARLTGVQLRAKTVAAVAGE